MPKTTQNEGGRPQTYFFHLGAQETPWKTKELGEATKELIGFGDFTS